MRDSARRDASRSSEPATNAARRKAYHGLTRIIATGLRCGLPPPTRGWGHRRFAIVTDLHLLAVAQSNRIDASWPTGASRHRCGAPASMEVLDAFAGYSSPEHGHCQLVADS